MKFRVIGITEKDPATGNRERCAEIALVAKHPGTIYQSQLWVKIPWSEVHRYPIDAEFNLVPVLSQGDVQATYAHPPICGDLPTLKAQSDQQ